MFRRIIVAPDLSPASFAIAGGWKDSQRDCARPGRPTWMSNSDMDPPFEEIRQVVRERNVDLVVMGSQGRGYMRELFLGSVSQNVARHAEAPLRRIPANR